MTRTPSAGWSRRDLLKAAGLAGLGATVLPSLTACGVGGGERHPNGAAEVTGSFDWKAAKGQTVRILQTPHPYQQSFQPLLNLGWFQTGLCQAPRGRLFRQLPGGEGDRSVTVLATRETLLLRGGHGDAVHDERRRRVVKERVDAQHLHALEPPVLPAWPQPPGCREALPGSPAAKPRSAEKRL